MLKSLLRFEWQLHSSQPVFFLALLVCGFFGGFLILNQSVDSDVLISSPYHIASIICSMAMMTVPFVICAFTSNAIARDHSNNMAELVYSTGLTVRQYLLSRWLGLVLVSSLVFLVGSVGVFIGLMLSNIVDLSIISMLLVVLWPTLLLVIPGIVLLSTLLFFVGLFSRVNIAIYVVACILFLLYQLLAFYAGSPLMARTDSPSEFVLQLLLVFDPFGATGFFEQVKYWNATQRNSEFFELNGSLLFNRMVVLLLSAGVFMLCYRRFEFKLVQAKTAKSNKSTDDQQTTLVQDLNLSSPVQPNSGRRANWQVFIAQAKLEYYGTLKTKVFGGLMVFWIFILCAEIIAGFSASESSGTTPVASTTLALWRFQYDLLPTFISLFLVFFAAQIAWRDEQLDVACFVHSSPAANLSLFCAKLLALLFIPLTFITLAIVVSVILQWFYGGDVLWSVYLSLYYYNALPMLCIAVLCLFINSISRHRFVSMTISFAIVLLSVTPVGDHLGLEHGMFKFSSAPLEKYSELNGYGASSLAFDGYIKYWLGLSLMMTLLAFGLFRRGAGVPLKQRTALLVKQWGIAGVALFVVASCMSLFYASNVYHQTHNVAHYQSSTDRIKWRAGYEQKYLEYQQRLSPKVIGMKTQMAFYPSQYRYEMTASFTLHNPHKSALHKILVSKDIGVNYQKVRMRGATLTDYDEQYGQYVFELNKPMAQGDTVQLSFNISQVKNGYLGTSTTHQVAPGFSYVQALRYMPFLGFNHHIQIKSPSLRQDMGLAALAPELSIEQAIREVEGDFTGDYDWVEFETQLSTSADEVAIAPGKLINRWQSDGRNYYHYKTSGPIRNLIGYLSGQFDMAVKTVEGVQLQVYYLENHKTNVAHTVNAMADSLQYGNKHFGRYQASQLRLIEVPRNLGLSGFAMPQTLLISEHHGFAVDINNDAEAYDQVYRRTAHEVAHQWWGHRLNGAIVEGEGVLTETLAKYTEMVLLEQRYGKEYVRRLMQYEHRRYFNGRGYSREHEVPLYRADAKHLIYSKGAIAMHALKDALGENAINRALRNLLNNHDYPKSPATTLDFVVALKAQTASEQHVVIDRWLNKIVIDDLSITQASYLQLKDDLYEVKLCVQNRTVIEDGLGNSRIDQSAASVWLGVFDKHPDKLTYIDADMAVLKLEKVKVNEKGACFNWRVTSLPAYVGIDPYYQMLDQQRDNNVLSVTKLNH